MPRLPLFLFAGMAMALAAAQKRPSKAGVFDYYVMSLSWAPDFCNGKAPGSISSNSGDSGNDECGQRSSHLSAMSSGRLFLEGLVATRAPLRFTGTRRLTRIFQSPQQKGTFLLCQQGDISTLP
jgi:hypothetical protein